MKWLIGSQTISSPENRLDISEAARLHCDMYGPDLGIPGTYARMFVGLEDFCRKKDVRFIPIVLTKAGSSTTDLARSFGEAEAEILINLQQALIKDLKQRAPLFRRYACWFGQREHLDGPIICQRLP